MFFREIPSSASGSLGSFVAIRQLCQDGMGQAHGIWAKIHRLVPGVKSLLGMKHAMVLDARTQTVSAGSDLPWTQGFLRLVFGFGP